MTTFLKLGGSVITEKRGDRSARIDVIQRISHEIAASMRSQPAQRILLGHGSGSFGHAVAAKHSTHLGARSGQDWRGFAEVWKAARELNSIILDALTAEGLPAVAFPPSASAASERGRLLSMSAAPIQRALDAGLLPVVYGDVVFDQQMGAAIASTEQVFAVLAESIKPSRLLLAGREKGVFHATGEPPQLIAEITPELRSELHFESPEGDDVTGGMASKVDLCLGLARAYPGLEILIFSAEKVGELKRVLAGERSGTLIRA